MLLRGRDGRRGQVAQVVQPDERQDAGLVAQQPGRLAPPPGEAQAEADVFVHAHLAKHARRLEGARHAVRGEAMRPLAADVVALGHQAARGGRLHA